MNLKGFNRGCKRCSQSFNYAKIETPWVVSLAFIMVEGLREAGHNRTSQSLTRGSTTFLEAPTLSWKKASHWPTEEGWGLNCNTPPSAPRSSLTSCTTEGHLVCTLLVSSTSINTNHFFLYLLTISLGYCLALLNPSPFTDLLPEAIVVGEYS